MASREPKFRARYVKKYHPSTSVPRLVSPATGFNIRQFIGCPFPTNVLLFTALSVTADTAVCRRDIYSQWNIDALYAAYEDGCAHTNFKAFKSILIGRLHQHYSLQFNWNNVSFRKIFTRRRMTLTFCNVRRESSSEIWHLFSAVIFFHFQETRVRRLSCASDEPEAKGELKLI